VVNVKIKISGEHLFYTTVHTKRLFKHVCTHTHTPF